MVPLLGAILGCHDQLRESGCGAIAGYHCKVLWLGGRVTMHFGGSGTWCHCHCSVGGVTTNFRGVEVVPLQGWEW